MCDQEKLLVAKPVELPVIQQNIRDAYRYNEIEATKFVSRLHDSNAKQVTAKDRVTMLA